MMKQLARLLVIGCIVTIVLTGRSYAEDMGSISSGETRSGEIAAAGEEDTWTFSASAGDRVMLSVFDTSDSFSPIVLVYAPDGSYKVHFTGDNRFGISQTGTYKMVVRDTAMTRTGTYNITFLNLTACPGSMLSCGATRSGTIDPVPDMDVWRFSATTSDRVILSAIPTSGDLHPYMRVFDPDGSMEEYDDLYINWSADETGTYTVVVCDGDTGAGDVRYDRTGTYKISFLNVDSCSGTSISSGEMRSGAIDSPSEMDLWNFRVADGEHVSIRVTATSGSLYPAIILYTPAHWSSHRGYGAVEWDAVRTGTCKVVVYDGPADGSDTFMDDTGGYEITVTCESETSKFFLNASSTAGGAVALPGEGLHAFAPGTSVYIVAVAHPDYGFTGWTGTAVDAGKVADADAASTTVTMDGDYTLVANFAPTTSETHSLTISSGAGGSVTAPGEGAFAYVPGTNVTVTATAQAGYKFTGWSGTAVSAGKVANVSATSTTVTVDGDYTLVANFSPTTATTHTLGISSGAGGSVTSPGEGAFAYALGTSVSIVATAETGYEFSGWSGTAVSAGKVADAGATSTTVTVDGDYTLVANFTAAAASTYTLSVSSGEGGSVTMPGEGAFACAPGATVSIQAGANSGYTFSGWTGTAVSEGKVANASAASTTVTVDADYTLVANFLGADHTLKVSATAGGWVTAPGEGSFSYNHGQSVTLEAQAQAGYHFVDWSGSLCSSSNPVSLEMNSDHHVTANFAVNPPTLTVSSGQGGSVIVPGEGAFVYACGVEVRAVAVPDAGYVFVGWTGTLVEMSGLVDPNAGRVDFAVEMDASLCANFAPVVRCLYVDDNGSGDPSPYNPLSSDPAEDGTWEHPFDSVQEAIDAADAGDAVLVLPGTYREHISFRGKDIMVSAFDLCTVGAVSRTTLAGTDANSVVVFEEGESAGSVLAGFAILGGAGELGGGVRCCNADPVIANCLIAGNRADQGSGVYCRDSRATLANCTIADNFSWLEGGGLYCDGDVTVINSILYGNRPEQIVADPCQAPCVTYSAVRGSWPGEGNLDCDPRFVEQGHWFLPADPDASVAPDDPEATWVGGNYHLKAKEGHWNGWGWLCDGSTSPCVDVGHPNADVKCEPLPNGNRINMGAFGGTAEASQSPSDATQP